LDKKLYDKYYWKLLLHFDDDKSEIRDSSFFLSPNGRYSLKDEMIATIKALYNEETFDDNSTACKYPARKRWLRENLGLKKLPKVECKKYNYLLERVEPTSVTLIFPSAHINSPASMFGHTFLRINSSYNSRLLSYAINYAANADQSKENAIIFSIKGLFGGYDGKYSLLPYYDKLKEYRDTESRDIWEYDLNITKEQTIKMFEHIWEIKDTKTPYYFFTDNCSYEMLWLIEIAKPSVKLRDKFLFDVIPLETIHEVKSQNLITSMQYRASKRSCIEAYKKYLTFYEIQIAKKLALSKEPLQKFYIRKFSQKKQRLIFEVAIELSQYYYQTREINKEQYLDIFHLLTTARAKLGKKENVKPTEPINPIYAHRAVRMSAGVGSIDDELSYFIGFRPAYHSLDDSLYGFLRGTQIEFLNIEGYYNNKNSFELNKATIISIESIAQIDSFFNDFSWRTHLGWDRDFLDEKSRFGFDIGAGYSIGNEIGYMYIFLDPKLYYANKFFFSADISGGFIVDKWQKSTTSKFEYKYKFYDSGDTQQFLTFMQNFRVKQNISFGIEYNYTQRYIELSKRYNENIYRCNLNYYF